MQQRYRGCRAASLPVRRCNKCTHNGRGGGYSRQYRWTNSAGIPLYLYVETSLRGAGPRRYDSNDSACVRDGQSGRGGPGLPRPPACRRPRQLWDACSGAQTLHASAARCAQGERTPAFHKGGAVQPSAYGGEVLRNTLKMISFKWLWNYSYMGGGGLPS